MKATFLRFAFGLGLIISLSIWGCGRDQNTRDDIPPSKPVLIARSADDAVAQQGIRAEPVPQDPLHWVRLEWHANPEGDVAGYWMYRGWEMDPPERHYVVADLRVGLELPTNATQYAWIDKGDDENGLPMNLLAPDSIGRSRGYYWEVRAYDEAGNKSEFSDRAYYRLIANASEIQVARADTNVYTLSWQYTQTDIADLPSYAMLRVYSRYFGPDSLVWYQRTSFYPPSAAVTMTFNPLAPGLHADCTYVAQINVISTQTPNPLEHTDSLAGAAAYTIFVYHN